MAEVELRTRRQDDEIGTVTLISGGEFRSQMPVACSKGSQFMVRNLFYNVPSRRKFIDGDNSRLGSQIKSEFQRVALCNPEVDTQTREIYCHSLTDGSLVWTLVADGIPGSPATPPEVASNTGYASATAATDGKYVCAIFATGDIICADVDGNRKWAHNVGVPDNHYGYVSSLVIWNGMVFVQFDNNDVRKVMAFDLVTGDVRWQKERGGKISWSSPIIAMVGGKAQLILMGNPDVTSYDAQTGQQLWQASGMSGEVCPSPCTADGIIYAGNAK